ncbi:MAG: GIY-YIG nuclease family protein [Sarcina sp.]
MNYVYVLECADGTLYTGWTNNIDERLKKHNCGKGAKYTRARLPVKLRYFEEFNTKSDAMKREYSIKKLTREKKLKLINKISD